MLDCKKLIMGKKKNQASKPAPLSYATSTNPNQLRARGDWQTKKNVSSNPKSIEQAPLDFSTSMPHQSKDQKTMATQNGSPNL